MPTMTDRRALTANQFTANVLAGKQWERADRPYMVNLYATASAAGPQVHFAIGSVAIVDGEEVNAQNRMPLLPDDFVARGIVRTGQLIIIRYREPAGATPTVFTRVDLIPL